MILEALKRERVNEFLFYCKKHRAEIDESYLYDHHLKDFEPDSENPTYIVTNDDGKIIATASLIINDYHRRGKKARFRIFHAEVDDSTIYANLLKALLNHTEGLDQFFIFITVENQNLANYVEQLNFSIERYAFLLLREDLEVPEMELPEDYMIRSYQPGKDERIWSEIRNAAFANLLGNETPITPEMVAKMNLDESYIEGGMKILFHKDKPVGIIRGAKDEYEDQPVMWIGPVAIIPEYQGKGLGRMLLREVLCLAREKSYKRTLLSVNGENDRAKALYIQEGFKQVEAVACYQYIL
ncbi:GNAT family N-acetyltransferase [Neobacillus sp. LXY-4]|uniref:GNAT family N-acetyltransferase n=1 Tax=Neobacillus sp. LXY-4 TaxID=3379826 RepID=UPI003EE005C1